MKTRYRVPTHRDCKITEIFFFINFTGGGGTFLFLWTNFLIFVFFISLFLKINNSYLRIRTSDRLVECRAWSVRPIWVCSRRLRPAEETESTTNRLAPSRPTSSTTRTSSSSSSATGRATTRPASNSSSSPSPGGTRARSSRWTTTWTTEWCHRSSHPAATKWWTSKEGPTAPAPSWTTVYNTWHHALIRPLDWLLK